MNRIILAGIAGGIAMFIWSSIAHMSPLGMVGFTKLANEQVVADVLKTATADKAGLYFFPWMDASTPPAQAPKSGPSGLLVYNPSVMMMTPGQLVSEFVVELIEALILAYLIAQTGLATLAARVGFAAAAGVMATMATNPSYGIWYGFPVDYTVAYMTIGIIGYTVAGVAIAYVLPKRATTKRAT